MEHEDNRDDMTQTEMAVSEVSIMYFDFDLGGISKRKLIRSKEMVNI